MRILVFYPEIPWPLERGTSHRSFHLLRELAGVHDIDLFAVAENARGLESKPIFKKFCRRVEFFPYEHPAWEKFFPKRLLNPLPAIIQHWKIPGVAEKLDELFALEKYEAVHLCDIVLAQYFMGRPAAGSAREKIPLIIDRSRLDLFYQWMEHQHLDRSWRSKLLRYENGVKLGFFERAVVRRAKAQIVCGEDDEKFFRKFISRNAALEVLVNGVDLEYFHPATRTDLPDEKPTLLFCGVMDYPPNIDALRWYFSEIHEPLRKRIPDLHVLIVGKNPADEVKRYSHLSRVTVTGSVPDVRPYYRRAWLQMVPLRIGGGSRLKIVESLAMGTPVVSTSIGAQGLGLIHEKDTLLADTTEDFIREITRALKDAALRRALGAAGIQTAHSRLSWPILGQRLIALYEKHFPKSVRHPLEMRSSLASATAPASPQTPANGFSTIIQ